MSQIKLPGMCGYVVIYNGNYKKVYAETLWKAVVEARILFKLKPRQFSGLIVMLAEDVQGVPVVHSTSSI